MLEYLYTHKSKYYFGTGINYIEVMAKQKLHPRTFPKKELLCIFVQNPSEDEIKKMSTDFGIDERYFKKFKTETRSARYSLDPLVFSLTDYFIDSYKKIKMTHLLFVIKNDMLLLTVSEQSEYFKQLFDTVVENVKTRKIKSETYLLYEFLHQDTKENYDVIENMDDKLSVLEQKIIRSDSDQKLMLQEIISLKKFLIKMNKRLWATSKIIFTIKKDLTSLKLSTEEKALLDDIYDTLMHQIDLIQTQKEVVTDLLEIYTTTLNNKLAEISNNLNIVMKKMAALTIIIMIPTMIASVYGTNFRFLPEITWKYGYLYMLGLMVVTAYLTYYSFHKKEWI